VFAQLGSPFKMRYQGNLKGDMTLIANSIVNRNEKKDNANSPYNQLDDKAKLNDEFEMVYIDIDNDETTFSSSSASLSLTKLQIRKSFMQDSIGREHISMIQVFAIKIGNI
jgi:hypothetical protein